MRIRPFRLSGKSVRHGIVSSGLFTPARSKIRRGGQLSTDYCFGEVPVSVARPIPSTCAISVLGVPTASIYRMTRALAGSIRLG